MEENTNTGNNPSTQYIRSDNMNNTVDNKQRHTKEEDPMNPSYSNPPLGNEDHSLASHQKGSNNDEAENSSNS